VKLSDIKPHLRTYSIAQRRTTTINHAFASALAPTEAYNEERLKQAMNFLGQEDLDNLRCVYCSCPAETWDHLVGLVKKSQLFGFGHQIGNLVPCCRGCNSRKGNTRWEDFVQAQVMDQARKAKLGQVLAGYLKAFATEVDLEKSMRDNPAEWQEYEAVKQQIRKLMLRADELAAGLRLKVMQQV